MQSASTHGQLGFSFSSDDRQEPVKLDMRDSDIEFWANFYSREEALLLFERLLSEIFWKQDSIRYYGKEIPLPRLTAWYGDKGSDYKYSGIGNRPNPWNKLLLDIRERVEKTCNAHFNSVLLNRYRNGNDGVSWHRDNEPELGPNPVIASLSFGQARTFQFRHRFRKELGKSDLLLTDGSLLVMRGPTQDFWEHQIPKTSRLINERINLTFRQIG